MTLSRKKKAKVQEIRTSTEPRKSASPRQLEKYGRTMPLEEGQKFYAGCERQNRTHGRTRERVVEDKLQARRTAGRKRAF
jgi:hypothetical protein